MNWQRVWNKIRNAKVDDLDEEMEFHRVMKEREFLAQGMTAAQARDASRRAMGNLTLAGEDARAEWTFHWIGDLGRDIRYAARTLAAQPGFTAAAVLALVLGIGVNAILFNIYNALALTPWALRDAGRVVRISHQEEGSGWDGLSWPAFHYVRDHSTTTEGVTAFERMNCQLSRKNVSWLAEGIAADENFFAVLGTGFAAGRGFTPSNGHEGDPAPEVVLHYEEWMRHFGGDRAAVGEWMDFNGQKLQIVGVAAEGFSGPVPVAPAFFIPAGWHDKFHPGTANMANRESCCTKPYARLKEGVTENQAQAEMTALLTQFDQEYKRRPGKVALSAPTMLADPRSKRESSAAFFAVGIAAFLILLLACANVANLQLARGMTRWREFAVRASLGASRGRLLRQLLVESAVLSALAGIFTGLVSAWVPDLVMRWIAGVTGANGSLSFRFENDWRVVVFVVGFSMIAALLFGLMPAWAASRGSVSSSMQQGGRATSTGRLRGVLLASQVVLCTVLLSGAALLLRALDESRTAPIGFAYEQMLVLNPSLDSSGVPEAQTLSIAEALTQRLQQVPIVASVTHTVVVPLGRRNDTVTTDSPVNGQPIQFNFNRVGANFFEAMGIPMVAGRSFLAADERREDAIIINETLARKVWANQNPVGKVLMGKRVVIGVARDYHVRELGPAGEAAAIIASPPSRDSQMLVRLRSGVSVDAAAGQIAPLVRDFDRRLLLAGVEPYPAIVDRSRQSAFLVAAIAGVLSVLALSLACVGIYGVAAHSVSQRTREIGVRMAMGARPGEILGMVLSENVRVVAAGAVVGLAGAYAFGRLLTSLLLGVSPADPRALAATVAILLLTAGIAAFLPARRAASVDPAITLRHD